MGLTDGIEFDLTSSKNNLNTRLMHVSRYFSHSRVFISMYGFIYVIPMRNYWEN